jgi:hypothetical protein
MGGFGLAKALMYPAVRLIERLERDESLNVDFIEPCLAVVLAARRILGEFGITSSSNCQSYAENVGLTTVLQGEEVSSPRGGKEGVTYSRLARHTTHNDVNHCNQIVADLLHEQLAGEDNADFVHRLVKVVGELHDNVPSHARGAGYSCAQVYRKMDGPELQYAIADSGCGMLTNVSRRAREISSHGEAINWCLQRGHTTASNHDDWAQRLPEDSIVSPYPPSVEVFSQDDHHVGEGLWQMMELVKVSTGSLIIWTGDALYSYNNGTESLDSTAVSWQGLAIELKLPVLQFRSATSASDESAVEELARRLGL